VDNMNPLLFAIIGVFGILYFAGWLVNVGHWDSRKKIPVRATLWFPMLAGLIFVAVDIYGFTVFPNGTPVIGLALAALLAHFFLFIGTIVQAYKLEKHRCPKCGRWMEIEKVVSDTDIDEAYVVKTTKRCVFCDYEETKEKKSIEGLGHVTTLDYFIKSKKEKKENPDVDVERIKADETGNEG